MKNIIDLPSEYWYGLTWLAQDLGYKSRQDLVAFLLKSAVDRSPDAKERGIEKANILDAARERVKQMEGRSLVLDPIEIPVIKKSDNLRWQLVLKSGDSVVVFAPSMLDAGRSYFKKPDLSIDEFWELVESGGEVKATYMDRPKTWNG